MAISLDAIYQPLRQFFLQKFGRADDSSVFFRFSHLAVGLYDSDFQSLLHPEWGLVPAVATELLSNLVDKIPSYAPEGCEVYQNPTRISDLYHDEMLAPAQPVVPPDTAPEAAQTIIATLGAAMSDANTRWTNCRVLSLSTNGAWVWPTSASPQDWWNPADTALWTSQSFHIEGAASTTLAQPSGPVLRMKVSDDVLRPILQSHLDPIVPPPPAPAPPPPEPIGTALLLPQFMNKAAPAISARTLLQARPMFADALASRSENSAQIGVLASATQTASVTNPQLHNSLLTSIHRMPFNERVEVQSMIDQHSTSQPVVVTDVDISFDYCLVTADRAWMQTSFLNNPSWFIPGRAKGALSANDTHGLPALPIGFVALRNLSIKAPWTPADITNLEQSVQFGPFLFDSAVQNGAIGHAGLQIVGWVLQELPDLPPVADPALGGAS